MTLKSHNHSAIGRDQQREKAIEPMRLLVVSPYYYPATCYGGPVRSTRILLNEIRRAGAYVEVLTTSANMPRDGKPRLDRVDDIAVRYCRRIRPHSWWFSPALGWRVCRKVSSFDVVYINGVWTYPVFATVRACRRRKIPYVMAPRGSLDDWALHYRGTKKQLYLALIEKRQLAGASAVHCLTQQEADQVRRVSPAARCCVIPNAIPVEEGHDPDKDHQVLLNQFPHLENKKIVLFLSRIHPKKGLDLLVPAFHSLRSRQPDLHLVLAGPNENGYATHVEHLVRSYEMDKNVTLPGLVGGALKRALFNAATVFVLPSYSEGLPVVALEAMAAGVPVVLTPGCNLPEVRAANAGIVVEPSVESVTSGLARVLSDKDGSKAMALAGKTLVDSKFRPDTVATQLLDMLETSIQHNRS